MRNLGSFLNYVLIVCIFTACSKDNVNLTPQDVYSDTIVWKDANTVETFINNIYRNALGFPFAISRLSDYSDESFFPPDWGIANFNKSLMTSSGLEGWGASWSSPNTVHYTWAPLFENVRNANIFFAKINSVPFTETHLKERFKGEVFFLRAYTYHYLVALYGGVPIITRPYAINDSFRIARNTYEECINFITADLDSAAKLLPRDYPADSRGRATRGAALALKARTLLYAASDLHASQTVYAAGYSNPELLGYPSGSSQTNRWIKARDAARALIDSGFYSLYKAVPATADSVAKNISDYFTSYGYETEDILLQYFSTQTDENWQGYNPALYCGPNGYHNWGNNCPIGELVDDYELKDGTNFDWTNPVLRAAPYENRDARFYATILYEGAEWRIRPGDMQAADPWNRIQVGAVYNITGDTVFLTGADSRSGPLSTYSGYPPRYFVRKFVDVSVDPQYVKQDIPFRHFRYAEVLLNYAESCIEVGGQDAEARNYINMIRKRAGQPDIDNGLSGAALRDACRHERRIELAYEDHRFWDIRRWMIGATAYQQMHTVNIKYLTGSRPSNYRKADGTTWGPAIYSRVTNPSDYREWNNKAYFFPIMADEIIKNSLLIQNPGY